MLQFGELGEADLCAWTLASETGYEWADAPLRPRVALSANVASGDRDPLDPDLETFNPLFPRGNYFSEAAILGPYNFYNAHVFLTLVPRAAWRVTLDHNMFWRLSTDDGVYGPSGRLIRAGLESRARFVANETSLTSSWSAGRHWSYDVKYTHFAPGRFLRETGPAKAVDFVQLTARFRF
jgi:Alginate export